MQTARIAVRYGYVPFMILGLNGVAVALVLTGQPYWLLGGVLLAGIAAATMAERVLPYEDDWNHSHGDTPRDIAHAIVYEISNINAVLLLPLITLLVPWEGFWPNDWPLWAQLAIAVIVADFGLSMLHWLSHRVGFLWSLHAVHHSIERLYGFNGLVRHPLHQAIDLSIGTMPLVLAGMPVQIAVLLGVAISLQLLLQHSNVDFRIGPFRNWLSIGLLHRMHHVNWGKEGDVNFGLFLTIWDRMLGTLVFEPSRPIKANDMGIDDEPDYPVAYLDQLIHPFWPRAPKRTPASPAPPGHTKTYRPVQPAE